MDTEFSDFITTELISIGLVSQDGQEFYAELPVNSKECSDFVREAVLPQLGKDASAQCSLGELNVRLRAWLDQFKNDDDLNDLTVICYDYSGDFTLLSYALNDQIPSWIRGANVNGYLNDLREEIWWRDHPELTRHHSLHDARALKESFVLGRAENRNWLNPVLLNHPKPSK